MAAKTDAFASYCAELLAVQGPTRIKRMFGGHGIYADDLFIAIVADEVLYLKADAQSRSCFAQAGCSEFVFSAKGRSVALGYWTAPVEAMDSPAAMRPWAALAMEAALRARERPGRKPQGRASPRRALKAS